MGYRILKNELGNSRGNLKEIVDKFHLLLKRTYKNIRQQETQESRKVMQRFNIELFEDIKRKITLYALKLTLQQYYRLKEPAVLKDSNQLPACTERYHTAFRLPCAHDIKCRLEANERLSLEEDFHSHWWYDK